MCGGDIIVARDSLVGHIFYRPVPPGKVTGNTLVVNHKRAAEVWLDDDMDIFYHYRADTRDAPIGSIEERLALRLALRSAGIACYVGQCCEKTRRAALAVAVVS